MGPSRRATLRYLSPHLPAGRRLGRRPPRRRWVWIVLGLFAALYAALFLRLAWRAIRAAPEEEEFAVEESDAPPTPGRTGLRVTWPTAQTNLLATDSDRVYMPPASGRVESALFGSARTVKQGKRFLASFHEGVDIAPTRRNRHGAPADEVFAVAEGRVGYVNRVAGNSTYGIYVVLLHEDSVGTIYTLYAHLASARPELKPGTPVPAGTPLGVMGHTSTLGIPVSRGHLHFEVGLLLNDRFSAWLRSRRIKPRHGRLNGLNLFGIDPQKLFRRIAAGETFSMLATLRETPPAFTIVTRAPREIDFFRRHPDLWQGRPGTERSEVIVISANEAGLPLAGRPATPEEAARLGRRSACVLVADPEQLGRNGRRLVVRSSGGWTLGSNGREWLELLRY